MKKLHSIKDSRSLRAWISARNSERTRIWNLVTSAIAELKPNVFARVNTMISVGEREIVAILNKWRDEDSLLCVVSIDRQSGARDKFFGKVERVDNSPTDSKALLTILGESDKVYEVPFSGYSNCWFGDSRAAPEEIRDDVADAITSMLQFIFADGSVCCLFEHRSERLAEFL